MTTFFQEDQVKTFVEIFFSSKSTGIYLRGFNKLTAKWQEGFQNNAEYTIDWNWFPEKLLMNKLYLIKTEIISDTTQ